MAHLLCHQPCAACRVCVSSCGPYTLVLPLPFPEPMMLFAQTFNHSYVSSPICCPSRTSLFTGRLPHNLADPALGWCGNFSSQMDNSFTNAIAAGGYTVGQFGKWFNEESTFCTPGYVSCVRCSVACTARQEWGANAEHDPHTVVHSRR
jgi:arylsulfatase A-like enzyme